jgi:HrpA-like RNA helicase
LGRKLRTSDITASDRFGYRPTPDTRPAQPSFSHLEGQASKRRLLERIQRDQQHRRWAEENKQLGREGWTDFGNHQLPAWHYKQEVMSMVATNRISILGGETGSGKSTQLAQWALEMGYDHVVYLQPRRVTTDNIADRIDEELTEQFAKKQLEKPDHLVGVAHSERSTIREDSVVQVMTSAVFTRRAPELSEKWQGKKVLIVADEIHEANIETEFAVATAAEMMQEQPSWSMALVSATVNSEEIRRAYTAINEKPIPEITIEGRPHEIAYHERPDKTIVDVYDEVAVDANKTLIFTDGKRSIDAITKELQRRHPDARILPLHSKITPEQRRAIFREESDQKTIIVSTSAGQSGITIPGVNTVISDGWTKSPELDGENTPGLPRRRCSKAELTQQMGRGARDIENGNFYLAQPLPSSALFLGDNDFVPFDQREEHAPADIYHTVITRNVLKTAAMDRDFYSINEYLIHKVTKDTIDEAYTVLKLMGAVDERNEVTDVGREMDKYPLRPELTRAIAEVQLSGDKKQKYQLAAIVAAIEAGGLASFNPEKLKRLKSRFSGNNADDDFSLQLKYLIEAAEHIELQKNVEATMGVHINGVFTEFPIRTDVIKVDHESLEKLGFDVVNTVRAYKQYRKISQAMGLEGDTFFENLSVPETIEETNALHEMLLTGMPHLLYQEVSRQRARGRRKTGPNGEKITPRPIIHYRNILGPDAEKQYKFDRTISNRSALAESALKNTAIIAGYPRWYIDREGETKNVIETGFATTRSAVHKALGRRAADIRHDTEILPNGRLVLVSSAHIGRLRTGQRHERTAADTREIAELLVDAAKAKQGSAQRELRKLVKDLTDLQSRIPANQRSYYFEKSIINQDEIDGLLVRAAQGAGSLGQLDANLRAMFYQEGLTLSDYISPENHQVIAENMPTGIVLGDQWYDIKYDDTPAATPIIVNFPLEHAGVLPNQLHIPDGREVVFRFHDAGGNEYNLRASDLKSA